MIFYSKKYNQPVVNDNSDIFYQIGEYIKNSPVGIGTT